jgi:hypothetical protein
LKSQRRSWLDHGGTALPNALQLAAAIKPCVVHAYCCVLQDADVEAEVAYITARQSTARTAAAGTADNNDAARPSSSGGESPDCSMLVGSFTGGHM